MPVFSTCVWTKTALQDCSACVCIHSFAVHCFSRPLSPAPSTPSVSRDGCGFILLFNVIQTLFMRAHILCLASQMEENMISWGEYFVSNNITSRRLSLEPSKPSITRLWFLSRSLKQGDCMRPVCRPASLDYTASSGWVPPSYPTPKAFQKGSGYELLQIFKQNPLKLLGEDDRVPKIFRQMTGTGFTFFPLPPHPISF